jgi:hypothetical protein
MARCDKLLTLDANLEGHILEITLIRSDIYLGYK